MGFPNIPLAVICMTGMAVAAPAPSATPAGSRTSAIPATERKIDLPVPVGEPVKGIKIPQYDNGGKLTMCLTAETAQKLNEQQVELHKLKVQFDDKEEKEIIVEIPHSILNLETKILTADSETVIRREDFEIVGATAVFDTLARQGTFKGRVHASFRKGAMIDQP